MLAVTGESTYRHVGAGGAGVPHRYLIAGATLIGGEGPWGHFEPQ